MRAFYRYGITYRLKLAPECGSESIPTMPGITLVSTPLQKSTNRLTARYTYLRVGNMWFATGVSRRRLMSLTIASFVFYTMFHGCDSRFPGVLHQCYVARVETLVILKMV